MIAALAAIAVLGTAACGSGTPGQSADEPTEDAGGKITVEFWQNKFSKEDDAWFKEAVEKYNASQDEIQIVHTVVPGDAWDQKLKAAQAAGKAPDMYTMNYSAIQPKARTGQLAPIGDLVAQTGWDDLDERFLDAVSVDGEQYAYPLYYEPSAIYFYRTDLYEQAGLDPASPPQTFDELIATGEKLKSLGGDTVAYQLAQNAVELSWTTWSSQYGTAGHLPISDDWTTAQADDPAYEPLFKLYQELYAKDIIAKQPLSPYGDATPLGEGKLASMTAGSWAVSQLLADWPDMVPNLAAAPMASVDGDPSRTTSTLGGWTIGVDAKSQKVEAAAKAISWMMAEDAVLPKDYFVKTSYTKLSPRVSIAEDLADDPERSENPFYDQIVDATKTAILEPTYDWQVSLAMGTALEKAMYGEDIKAVQAEANKTITDVIAELNLPEQLK